MHLVTEKFVSNVHRYSYNQTSFKGLRGSKDMSLRDWLILFGVMAIAGVIADGYRRMRLAKKRSTELSFGLEEIKGSEDDFGSELPNGGARKRTTRSHFDPGPVIRDRVEPGFSAVDDPFDDFSATEKPAPEQPLSQPFVEKEEPVGSLNMAAIELEDDVVSASVVRNKTDVPPVAPTQDELELEESVPVLKKEEKAPAEPKVQPAASTAKVGSQNRAVKETVARQVEKARPGNTRKPVAEKLSERPPASEIIVINVLAKGEDSFDGEHLFQFLLSQGMRFGDMGIFHRHVNNDGSGRVLFSMANGIEPGRFDIDNLEKNRTPIVSFFMGLPGPENPMQAFTLMEETAQRMALDLGGELKDEQLSVMTQQTLEHCRQRIREYSRKQLANKVSS